MCGVLSTLSCFTIAALACSGIDGAQSTGIVARGSPCPLENTTNWAKIHALRIFREEGFPFLHSIQHMQTTASARVERTNQELGSKHHPSCLFSALLLGVLL